jgi:hypothetical protein
VAGHHRTLKASIVLGGGLLLCPHCEESGTMAAFKALDLNAKYQHDLNPVYKHVGCGHVFSPGDPWIIAAYLSGDLVPAEMVTALRETVNELRAVVAQMKRPEDERRAVQQ